MHFAKANPTTADAAKIAVNGSSRMEAGMIAIASSRDISCAKVLRCQQEAVPQDLVARADDLPSEKLITVCKDQQRGKTRKRRASATAANWRSSIQKRR